MIARIWRTTVDSQRAADYEDFARTVSLPMFRQQQGYAGVIMGRSGDSCIVMTLWHSKSDVDALDRSRSYKNAVQQILAKGFLLGEQTTEAFDVHTLDVRAG
jgi:heme-degrading monooxygenase HmoA